MKRIICIALILCAVSAEAGWWHRGRGFTVAAAGSAPTNGLVSYWKFDGDVTDSGPEDVDLTAANLTSTTGVRNTSYYIATDGYAYDATPKYTPYNFGTNDFSISCWVKSTATSQGGMVSRYSATVASFGLVTDGSGSNVWFLTRSGSGAAATHVFTSLCINDGVWHHVVAVRKGTLHKVYVDHSNTESNTSTIRDVDNTSLSMILGRYARDAGGGGLGGSLDEIRIYSRALSDSEVEGLYYWDKP